MCGWGNKKELRVLIPARLSHTGAERWETKPVDACLADIVAALNAARLYTAASCCGHGRGQGSIVLHDGRLLLLEKTRVCRRCRKSYALVGNNDRSEYCPACWGAHFEGAHEH